MENTFTLGRIGLNIRGAFGVEPEERYNELDVVTYNGSSYVSMVDENDSDPTDDTKWKLLAAGYPSVATENADLYALGIQFGTTARLSLADSAYKDTAITFPKPFKEGCVPVCIPVFYDTSTAPAMANSYVAARSATNTGFTIRSYNKTGSTRNPFVNWIAIGIPDPAQIAE